MDPLINKYTINHQITWWVTQVKGSIAMNFTDLSKDSENMLVALLSYVYNLPDLHNLNTGSINFPAIDLADDKQRVAIQVTSTASSQKIKHTLNEFVKNKLYNKYDHLIVYILTEKLKRYSGKGFDGIIQGRFRFEKDKDIQDYRDLLEVISGFQSYQLDEIKKILDENIGIIYIRDPEIINQTFDSIFGLTHNIDGVTDGVVQFIKGDDTSYEVHKKFRMTIERDADGIIVYQRGSPLKKITGTDLEKLPSDMLSYIRVLEKSARNIKEQWEKEYPNRRKSSDPNENAKIDQKLRRIVVGIEEELNGIETFLESVGLWLDDHYIDLREAVLHTKKVLGEE